MGLTGLRMILKGPSSSEMLLISQTGEVPGHAPPTHSQKREREREMGGTSRQPAAPTASSAPLRGLSPGPDTGYGS